MLTILLIMAMFGQGQSWDSLGRDFITAFPENIAFYYPVNPANALNITALYNNTVVTVSMSNAVIYQGTPPVGMPVTVTLPISAEEHRFGQTLQAVKINSTYKIAVLSISKRGNSVQTNVVQPLKNLGTLYSIPNLNYSRMINTLHGLGRNSPMRYSSFRLVIINGVNVNNNVGIVKMAETVPHVLTPYAVLQLQINGTEISVQSQYKVAVMLTHPCVEMAACNCNMVVNQLYPWTPLDSNFAVPSILDTRNLWLHLTSSDNVIATGGGIQHGSLLEAYSSILLPLRSFKSESQSINTSVPASLRLIGPGFIIEPIPQSRFSACFLAAPVSLTNATAFVIAETQYRDSVHIDDDLLPFTLWQSISNSKYSSISVPLDGMHVIWHPSTTIAVYVFEKGTNVYGGPAIPLSEKPDPFGCAVTSSKFTIISTPQTWPQSHQSCLNISEELFNPSYEEAQTDMNMFLKSEGLNERLWIGLRRDLLTLEWYWRKGEEEYNLTYTKWGAMEPRIAAAGMCASVFPNSTMGFQWESESCCAHLKSICYTSALYFPLYLSDMSMPVGPLSAVGP